VLARARGHPQAVASPWPVRLPRETADRLAELAKRNRRLLSARAAEAIAAYVKYELAAMHTARERP
jgi:predicted transcriptional regulator